MKLTKDKCKNCTVENMCTTGTLPNSEECLMKGIDDGMLTKEECLEVLESSEYLEVVIKDERARDVFRDSFKGTTIYNTFEQLIKEHFDNPPLNMNDLKQLIGKPIFNNDRKEWFLLIAVRDGANKEIDVISTKKQYKETYGYRDNCFFTREVKE